MPSDDLDMDRSPESVRSLTTNGAIARARRRRIIALVALSLLLLGLAYAAYFYTQNHRAPSIDISTTAAAADKVQTPVYLYSFSGTGVSSMNQPTGVAIVGNRCYVTDFAYHTVRAYSLTGTFLFDFGAIKDGARTKLVSPVHLAVGPDGTVWVTDRGLKGLYVFDQNGTFLRKVMPNNDPSFAWSPLALAFDSTGDLYVTDVGDSTKHRVLVLAKDGTLVRQWGSTAQVSLATDSPGKFYFPNGIVVKGSGADAIVFVADGNNRRVQEFRTDGTFVRMINTGGTPRGLGLDAEGHLYVVDALAHRVDLYDDKGASLATFGENGTGPGQFNFPNDLAFDGRGRVFIADRENDQVQVWGPLAAQIPGITRITPSNVWVPLTLLALVAAGLGALGLRRKRFVATPDFIDGMIAAGVVPAMAGKRFAWAVTNEDKPPYEDAVSGNVKLGDLLAGEPHSVQDAQAIRDRLGVTDEQAAILALAKRSKVLCTEDVELARYAVSLGIDVYDRETWLKAFGPKAR